MRYPLVNQINNQPYITTIYAQKLKGERNKKRRRDLYLYSLYLDASMANFRVVPRLPFFFLIVS